MNGRLEILEELKIVENVVPTVEERTSQYEEWVKEKIGVCEMILSTTMHILDYYLNRRELINDRLFDNKFELVYSSINEYMRNASWICCDYGISGEVLDKAVKEFKQKKSKVRKVKAEYKRKFAELRMNKVNS